MIGSLLGAKHSDDHCTQKGGPGTSFPECEVKRERLQRCGARTRTRVACSFWNTRPLISDQARAPTLRE